MQLANILPVYNAYLSYQAGGERDPETWTFTPEEQIIAISGGGYGTYRSGIDIDIVLPTGFVPRKATLYLYTNTSSGNPYVTVTQLDSAVSDTPDSVPTADLYANIANGASLSGNIQVASENNWTEIPLNSSAVDKIISNRIGNNSNLRLGLMPAGGGDELAYFKSRSQTGYEPYLVIEGSMPQIVIVQ